MANLDAPKGARPINRDGSAFNGSLRKVEVDASNATAIFVGDFVVQEADGNYTPATAGTTNVIAGVCVGVVVDKAVPSTEYPGYMPATTAGHILIVDADACYFAIQEDGTGSDAARGSTANFLGTAGSTTTGNSAHELDTSEVGQDAADQLKLIEKVSTPDNDYGLNCDWIVKINLSQHGRATAGV